jgi:tRNA pseudouridine38-40 synthase
VSERSSIFVIIKLLLAIYSLSILKIKIGLRYFIEIAYKGTDFHGWQIQPDAVSIQETIQNGLQRLLGTKIDIVGAGRTDAGVHARQIFAHFDVEESLNTQDFTYRLNSVLPQTIIIKKILQVQPNTHARFDALYRSYEYHIHLTRDPFIIDTSWQLFNVEIDIDLMNQASKVLLKYTNFKAFSKTKTDVKTYDCIITEANWFINDNKLIFRITANRFLRNMVRAIVGTLIEVGIGKRTISDFENVIIKQNRSKAGVSVPARGLFLSVVSYPETIFI